MAEKGKEKPNAVNLALIATYPKMSEILIDLVNKEDNIYLHNRYASFDEAIEAAIELEDIVDAIISRGATAEYIKRAIKVPVISIPISPFDLVQSIYNIDNKENEVAFFNCSRCIYGVREIEDMFNIKIHEYTFNNEKDIENGINDCFIKGINTIIGGNVAVSIANLKGMRGIEISSGRESIYQAFKETITLVNTRREEIKKAARLEVVFNSLTEGIIVTDNKKNVLVCNAAAKKIMHSTSFDSYNSNAKNVSECNINNDSIKDNCKEILNSIAVDTSISNSIKKINGTNITVSKYPVKTNNEIIGYVTTIEDVTKIMNLENQIRNKLYTKGFVTKYTFDDIIYNKNSENMNYLMELAKLYAKTDSAILIYGETGTGKELFAQSIHNASKISNGPFVAVNCSSIPENLIESELFGYEAGAFTGASKEGKKGFFELAHGGTIFLDEIGEIPLSLQSRLLRVIQEKEIIRVGGDKVLPVNVRIISATNKNLQKKIEIGEFREDLYYRLNVFMIEIPPLRERKEDISVLINHMLENNYKISNSDKKMFEKLMPLLENYYWPGNVRQLNNAIERISILFNSTYPDSFREKMLGEILGIKIENDNEVITLKINVENGLKSAVSKAESEIIKEMLKRHNNNHTKVQKHLKISRSTLWRKISE